MKEGCEKIKNEWKKNGAKRRKLQGDAAEFIGVTTSETRCGRFSADFHANVTIFWWSSKSSQSLRERCVHVVATAAPILALACSSL